MFYSGASVVILFAIEANLLFEEAHSFASPPNRCPKFFMTSACLSGFVAVEIKEEEVLIFFPFFI